ncbi:MAG: pilus assembly protein PilM [Verrucomicrobia bacterium]|nr:pilus assembly protein PilM [Verrucomicrobiota bacterium]MDE3098571.1 pilus assembly protein PilM [Verrucomicrobiota bacterium]
MTLPFLNGSFKKKRNQIMAVDLGSRTTKAVLVERRGDALALTRYAMVDAPISDKKIPTEAMIEHLRTVAGAVGGGSKAVALSVGQDEALVRQVELPQMPIGEVRQMVKLNSKNILQQELPDHVFDIYIFAPKTAPAPETKGAPGKMKVLVGAAPRRMVDDYQAAVKGAGLAAEYMVPGLVGPINAFELSLPQVFENESVALVDIGFKHSTICLLDRGQLALSRTVNIGGDKLTAGLAEAMSISYAEAEGIKIGLAPEARAVLETQVAPLGRELRASIDFFEHQQDRQVTQIYVCGGAAPSEVFLEMLRVEMLAECKTWNPTAFLQLALPDKQAGEIAHVAPQLSVAIGAAVAAL